MDDRSDNPELSVCIATYNYGRFLRQCIDSILNQSFTDFELIVCDNASSDDTNDIIQSYSDKRIRYYRHEANIGPQANFNHAIKLARGRYIRLMCADDVLLPDVLEDQISILENHPEVGVVSCDFITTDEFLAVEEEVQQLHGIVNGREVCRRCTAELKNLVGGPSNFMFRASSLPVDPFENEFKYLSDLVTALKVLQRWDYGSINRNGYLYRRHGSSDTAVSCPSSVQIDDWLRVIRRFGKIGFANAKELIKSGRMKSGWHCFSQLKGRYTASGMLLILMNGIFPYSFYRGIRKKLRI